MADLYDAKLILKDYASNQVLPLFDGKKDGCLPPFGHNTNLRVVGKDLHIYLKKDKRCRIGWRPQDRNAKSSKHGFLPLTSQTETQEAVKIYWGMPGGLGLNSDHAEIYYDPQDATWFIVNRALGNESVPVDQMGAYIRYGTYPGIMEGVRYGIRYSLSSGNNIGWGNIHDPQKSFVFIFDEN